MSSMLAACGNTNSDADTSNGTQSTLQMVEEVTELEDATIVVPNVYLGDEIDEYVAGSTDSDEANDVEAGSDSGVENEESSNSSTTDDAGEKSQGNTVVKTDERGNATIDFDGDDRTNVVNSVAREIENGIVDVLGNDLVYPNITDIKVNSDCSEFTIYISTNQPTAYESMLVMSFYMMGNKYQIYNGVSEREARTTVIYVNSNTGSEIARSTSDDMQY